MSSTITSRATLRLYSLALFAVTCFAQTNLSIISQPPLPNLPTSTFFTPNGPSSSFDSLGTGSSTTPTTTIYAITEPSFPPTLTSCFIPPTGTVSSTHNLDPSLSIYPPGAACIEVIRASGHVIEVGMFTVAADGATLPVSDLMPQPSSTLSPSSSSFSVGTGAIVGAVIGSVFGTLLIGATLFWIRKQRRSSKAAGAWLHRPAAWVRDEKQPTNVMEMSPRTGA